MKVLKDGVQALRNEPGGAFRGPDRTASTGDSSGFPRRTVFLARLIGLYMILISLPMVFNKQRTIEIWNAVMGNPSLLFIVGILGMTAGLAIILAHSLWSRGALAIFISLTGWIALSKGMLLIVVSMTGNPDRLMSAFRYDQLFYVYMAFTLCLGAWLAYSGFAHRLDS